jgi:hypothetical protein
MIRANLLKDVYKALQYKDLFLLEDFMVEEYANKESEPCLVITYRYDSGSSFRFHIPTAKSAPKEGNAAEHCWASQQWHPAIGFKRHRQW